MQVRDAVAEQVVVHLDGSHHVFDSRSDEPEFAPIARRLFLGEFRRLDYVAAAPDRDGEATLDVRTPQVGVYNLSGEETYPVVCFVRSPLLTSRTAPARLPFVEG
jgi:predicted dienelactone hydrolase